MQGNFLRQLNYPSVTLTRMFLDLWLGIFSLRSVAWDPGLGILGLGLSMLNIRYAKNHVC